jgi:hypothetical protein
MSYLNLMQQLWQDDCGGIITAEYLLLGSVLTVGTVSGMTAMRDATVEEMRESGNTVRAVREHYTPSDITNQRAAKQANATKNNANFQGQYCINGNCP